MHTLLSEKILAFRVPASLVGKRMHFKKLIAGFIILLTVGIGVGGLTGTHAVAAPYIVLLETDADANNQEIFIVSYDSYADLISNNQAGGVFSQLNINSLYSVGGLAYDGNQFHVLLEIDADAINQEIFIVSYDSYADLISNNQASGVFSQLNINSLYSVGGLAYDGSQFHVMLETDADAINQEIFIVSYDSYADLISNNQAGGVFSQLNINSLYSAGGITALNTGNGGNGNVVSEPATMVLILIGLSLLSVFIRRKGDVCCQARI